MLPDDGARARIRQAWRDIHEAVSYAANATRCAQYTDFADHRARRGDLSGDLDALRCMQQGGQLTSDEARRYERLHTAFGILMREEDSVVAAAVDEFMDAVHALEATFWALVPVEQLPGGMFAPSADGTTGQLRLIRRSRRAGDFVL
jgi:hypothetical protein